MAPPILFPLQPLTDAGNLGSEPFLSRLQPDTQVLDTYAFTAQSRSVAFYRGSYSLNVSAADAAVIPDTYAAPVASRPTSAYKAPMARIMNVFDPLANTFADWTPAALLSRAVQNYKPPAVQPQVAWGQSIVTDVPVAGAFSRVVAFYRPPTSQPVVAWGQSIITDQYAPFAQSRPVPLFRSPAAFLASVYNQSSATLGTDYAQPALSRIVAYYRGSYSAVSNAADAAIIPDTWVALTQSRPSPRYQGSWSRAVGAADQIIPDDWALVIASRFSAYYTAPRSLVLPVFDQLNVVFGTDYAQPVTSRIVAYYRGSYSAISNAADVLVVIPGGTHNAARVIDLKQRFHLFQRKNL